MTRFGTGSGRYNRWVQLSRAPQTSPDDDGFFEPLSPESVWCAISPSLSVADGRAAQVVIEMRFHPQVTIDTRVAYNDPVLGRTREFFVRGVQNLDDANVVHRLICEEIAP